MSSLFGDQPLSDFLRRPLFRVLFLFLLFVIFFILFLPPTFVPSLADGLHHSSIRPLIFAPPSPESLHHRIKAQRPLNKPLDHDHQRGDIWARRADAVREAFLHAYDSYVAYAAPHDELLPLTKTPTDKCVLSPPLRAFL